MTFMIIFFSNAGGLGGGGSMVPVILIFFKFDIKRSIALSNSTIFVSATIRYLVNLSKKHPTKKDLEDKPTGVLVDYNIAILMLPALMMGVTFGAILNTIMPEVIILIGLCILMSYVVYTNFRSIFRLAKGT
jgi:uncharacterized membrane protein YfcA